MSCNTNQNHLVRKGRTTSRVLAPPGGHSSFSLGVAPPKKTVVEPPPVEEAEPVAIIVEQTAKENETTEEEEKEQTTEATTTTTTDAITKDVTTMSPTKPSSTTLPGGAADAPASANAFVTGAAMNGGSVMTGRPTSRVLAPPGGHSSFKLG